MTKSKRALKKCIEEINREREINTMPVSKIPNKIAAPKPVRPKPQTLTHTINPKWLETSPIKNEREEVSDIDGRPNLCKQFATKLMDNMERENLKICDED